METDNEQPIENTEPEFMELSELEYQALNAGQQRVYRKDLERHKAKVRKQAQRDRERQGIPTGVKKKFEAEWEANIEATKADPETYQALRERAADFGVVRHQCEAVIHRINNGIHPETMGDGSGRFFECIADDLLDLVKKYGLARYDAPHLFITRLELVAHPRRQAATNKLKADPEYFYRATYGLDIDHVSALEFYEFFNAFFNWYLTNRCNPDSVYEWSVSDRIANEFAIPEDYLSGVLAMPPWTTLDKYRRGIHDDKINPKFPIADVDFMEPARIRDEAEIRRSMREGRLDFLKATLLSPDTEF